MKRAWAMLAAGLLAPWLIGAAEPAKTPSTAEILAASPAADWRPLDPQNTLYMDLPSGRVVVELAPRFAAANVANIKVLVRGGYFDGLAIERVQDNYVAQWGDADGKRPLGAAHKTEKGEFVRPIGDLPFTALPDPDTWAPQVGFTDGFPAARDPAAGQTWLAHCYGTVGVGRDNDEDSGGGSELYAVIGQSPRMLDRNITVAGRVVQGIELLASLPRGPAPMGFYAKPNERTAILKVRLAADLPAAQRLALEALKTDSPTFAKLVQARRFRSDAFYHRPAGRIDLCSMPLPVRIHPG